jgi:peptidoglycan/LPS O-acetylase OafA/YrhL
MLFHLQGWLSPSLRPVAQFGWTGVDLFFVLSGFLIGAQLLKAHAAGGPILWRFYRRRLLRIMPLYLVVVAIYFLWPACREAGPPRPLWQILTFTENLFFNVSGDTWPSFTHVWSLCIEEQFYLVLPIALILTLRRPSIQRAAGILLGLVGIGISIRTWVFVHQLKPLGPEDAVHLYWKHIYYPTYSRMDGLLAGLTLALIQRFRPQWWSIAVRRGHSTLVAGSVLVALALSLFKDRFKSQTGPAAWGTFIGFPLISLGLALVVASALSENGLLRRKLFGAKFIATLAFSLYLTHKFAANLARTYLPMLTADRDARTFITYAITCFTVAAALHYLIERPFLALRDHTPRPIQAKLQQDPAL